MANQSDLHASEPGGTCRSRPRTGVGRLLARYLKNRKGVTTIEFAVVAMPFFLLTVGMVELGAAFMVNRVLDNAALEASRLIRTGQAQKASFDPTQFKNEVCRRMTDVLCRPGRLTIDVRKYSQFGELAAMPSMFDDEGDLRDDTSFDMGGANDIVVARLIYRWPMMSSVIHSDAGDTGDMQRLLYSTVVFRNEPFPW